MGGNLEIYVLSMSFSQTIGWIFTFLYITSTCFRIIFYYFMVSKFSKIAGATLIVSTPLLISVCLVFVAVSINDVQVGSLNGKVHRACKEESVSNIYGTHFKVVAEYLLLALWTCFLAYILSIAQNVKKLETSF